MIWHGKWQGIGLLPQTLVLIAGVCAPVFILVLVLGSRPLVWAVALLIGAGMVAVWIQVLQQHVESANLLDRVVFLHRLSQLEQKLQGKVKGSVQPRWQEVRRWTVGIQAAAAGIAERDGLVTPELLETLYTTLSLTEQVVETLLDLDQLQVTRIQATAYRQVSDQHLNATSERLHQTHDQLQRVRELLLEQPIPDLTQRIQEVTEQNKATLLATVGSALIDP